MKRDFHIIFSCLFMINKTKMLFFYLLLMTAGQKVDADATTSVTATTVYRTVTLNRAVLTIPSIFTQNFAQFYDTQEQAPSGSIGIGAILGHVGDIRVYDRTTVSGGAQAQFQLGKPLGCLGALGVVAMMLI